MKVTVLGCGMVGAAIVRDLADDFEVLAADLSGDALSGLGALPGVRTMRTDLSSPESVRSAIEGADLVVGAVPGFMGYGTVETVIKAGVDIVDISFFPEDCLGLDAAAREKGVRCLVDFGVAPGCSNLLFGHSTRIFSRLGSFSCMVGGLPELRIPPWEYMAPFSPSDVIEEYTRTARIVREGKVVSLPPLTESELVGLPGVGTVEAFLTDGLRSLLRAEGVPTMIEKTLRYPGYIDKVKLLKESGFLSSEPIELNGRMVVPLELTSRLLFEAWKQGPLDRDLTVMRVVSGGIDTEGIAMEVTWDLLDRFDDSTGTSSMARTTGYTCTAGIRMLASGLWDRIGTYPPEDVGKDDRCFAFVIDELAQRGIRFEKTVRME